MAKSTSKNKEPGRIKQMWEVFQMTRKIDKASLPLILAALLVPIAAGILLAVFISEGNPIMLALYILLGLLLGVLLAMIVLGRRAEKAAYSQIEGRPGAVGSILKSALRGSWRGNEMPVAVNKNQDAIYRAIGRGGVVIIAEGPRTRTTRMVEDERRKIARILPNVEISSLQVGPDADAVPLHKISKTLRKKKNILTKQEVVAVSNRLSSLSSSALPIPKGIDPTKVRPQRAR